MDKKTEFMQWNISGKINESNVHVLTGISLDKIMLSETSKFKEQV